MLEHIYRAIIILGIMTIVYWTQVTFPVIVHNSYIA